MKLNELLSIILITVAASALTGWAIVKAVDYAIQSGIEHEHAQFRARNISADRATIEAMENENSTRHKSEVQK